MNCRACFAPASTHRPHLSLAGMSLDDFLSEEPAQIPESTLEPTPETGNI